MMIVRFAQFFPLFLIMVTIPIPIQACTTFIIGDSDRQLFGRNYDWHFSDGYIMVNKKGVRKKAYVSGEEPKGKPAAWTSRFGSITFNQFGREFPQGGMNEAGLVIESMSLMSTTFPDVDGRPYVRSANLWRQYLLDTCASVRDVIASDSKIRISDNASKSIGTHVLVLDNEGDAAAIEFLNGVMVVHTGDSLPMRVLTNSTYEASLPFWINRKAPPLIDKWSSIKRFITAADFVSNYKPEGNGPDLDYAFKALAAVSSSMTRWRIVYDNINMEIFFRTDGNPKIRHIDMKAFNFSCKKPVKVLDINADLAGNISHKFSDYTSELNIHLMRNSCAKLAASTKVDLPPQIVELIGRYPEQFRCEE